MLEVPSDSANPQVASVDPSKFAKSIPLATFRSSKLAAMAANMSEPEIDVDLDYLTEEDLRNDSEIPLDDVLIVPEVNRGVDNANKNEMSVPSNLSSPTLLSENQEVQQSADNIENGAFSNFKVSGSSIENGVNGVKDDVSRNDNNSTSLSLSCVNSGNDKEHSYRLGSM